ncbi:MAG: FprA family A-type flavoprotein [Chloroflexi bacterium]|nr:FprA family A-type flavoprotein [Chloroflexota bacterium]
MENTLVDGVYWVGVHFPQPAPGAALNCYLITDEQRALVDTGAPATAGPVLANIRAIVDPTQIDYVVLTHADMDHGGGLKELLVAAPQATVVISEYEARMLPMWGVHARTHIVHDGDTLSLGQRTLRFLSCPFICTPGSMLVFDETDQVLFSGDLFALLGPQEWRLFAEGDQTQALKMVQPLKLGRTEYVNQALARVKDLPVRIVASGHGQALRGDIPRLAEALMG